MIYMSTCDEADELDSLDKQRSRVVGTKWYQYLNDKSVLFTANC